MLNIPGFPNDLLMQEPLCSLNKKKLKKKKKRKERTRLLMGVVEEKVYYTLRREYSQRLGHLGESRVVMTLSCVWWGGRERGGQRYKSGAGIQNVWIM